jgi:multidrug efflux system outer membrane protein
MTGLIENALKNNMDVKTAAYRVEQYLGVLQTTGSQFFPQFSGDASGKNVRVSRSVYGASPVLPRDYDNYSAALNAAGRSISGPDPQMHEASRAQVLSGEEARRAVILTLVTM